jgi:4-diphosphocytidyl-2-C-methyl-D-erythritol kinase
LLRHRRPDALDAATWARVAVSVGADVPFFLAAAGAGLVQGVGDQVEPLPPPIEPLGVVLARPAMGLATRAVFEAWDALQDAAGSATGDPGTVDRLAAELRAGATPATLLDLAGELRDANDLWSAAVLVEPRLDALRDALESRLGRPALMTGSGSTLVVLCATPHEALDIAQRLRQVPLPGLERGWVEATASGTPYPPDIDIVEEAA